MPQAPDYRLIATRIGESIKKSTVLNEIRRTARAIFHFQKESFPNDAITSSRSKEVYDWIMTLAKQCMDPDIRNSLLIKFCKELVPEERYPEVEKILKNSGIMASKESYSVPTEFTQRNLHSEIHRHCKTLYLDGHYFHAVFEACKVYNKSVKTKAEETKDGHALMLSVWGPDGVLKVTPCKTETDKNVQNGIKFLSAGLMQAVRNPTAHEPAVEWPISKEDCLNILSFMSFLFKTLDDAVYDRESHETSI